MPLFKFTKPMANDCKYGVMQLVRHPGFSVEAKIDGNVQNLPTQKPVAKFSFEQEIKALKEKL